MNMNVENIEKEKSVLISLRKGLGDIIDKIDQRLEELNHGIFREKEQIYFLTPD